MKEPATILPRLPAEVDIIHVRRQGKDDTHKDFRVRRHQVEEALRWLKDNNPAYSDIVIDSARIRNLPEDGELPNLTMVEFSETEHMDDQGPAPQQLVAGETDASDDSTVSGVILAEPGVNVQAEVEAALNQVVSEPREVETDQAQQGAERPVIPWPTTDTTPASEFTNPYFFKIVITISTVQFHVLHSMSEQSTCCGTRMVDLLGIKCEILLTLASTLFSREISALMLALVLALASLAKTRLYRIKIKCPVQNNEIATCSLIGDALATVGSFTVKYLGGTSFCAGTVKHYLYIYWSELKLVRVEV